MRTALKIIIAILICAAVAGCAVMITRLASRPSVDNNTQIEQPTPDSSDNTDEPEGPDEPVVTEYTVTFVADGLAVTTASYVDETSAVVLPEVPEKLGYTGSWESFELNGGDKTVNAVYEAITYKINYHVVQIDTSSETGTTYTVDYIGTWDEYWSTNGYIITLNYPKEYTIESEDIVFPAMYKYELDLNGMNPSKPLSGKLSEWYIDKECTTLFSGTIPKGSTGDIELFSKWTLIAIGPF